MQYVEGEGFDRLPICNVVYFAEGPLPSMAIPDGVNTVRNWSGVSVINLKYISSKSATASFSELTRCDKRCYADPATLCTYQYLLWNFELLQCSFCICDSCYTNLECGCVAQTEHKRSTFACV